ncbi:hypothetical protein CDIK_2563 [Cucumispora dikerogammari]|nr:hypothetical protein CDIK_2563 [Cucumispora dikerogammari]
MSDNQYLPYLQHFEERLGQIESSVFIIDSDTSISSNNILSDDEARIVFTQYYSPSRIPIIVNKRQFKYIDAVQASEGSHFVYLYLYTNPDILDEKRIYIITQLAEGVIYGIEASEVYRLDVLEIMHNMFN